MDKFTGEIYLISCALNNVKPDEDFAKEQDWNQLFHLFKFQGIDMLIYPVIRDFDFLNLDKWKHNFELTVKNSILFDNKRDELYKYMDSKKIWHADLKGIVLKEYYPMPYMRSMADNDILFDSEFSDDIIDFFTEQQFKAIKDNTDDRHLCFHKAPCYNFEMHKQLFVDNDLEINFWQFFKNIEKRLIGQDYHLQLSKEDFYLYLLCHYNRHFSITGAGLRPIIDLYVFLNNNDLDWKYIKSALKELNLTEFEELNRNLSLKLFSDTDLDFNLNEDEFNLLCNAFKNSPNGTIGFMLENKISEVIESDKNVHTLVFPSLQHMKKHGLKNARFKLFLPIYWVQYNYRRIKTYGLSSSYKSFFKIWKSKK